MTPLFKTHFSQSGRSILTVDSPEKDKIVTLDDKSYKRSVLSLAKDEDTLVFVEDFLAGFRRISENCKKAGKKIVFGLRANTRFGGESASKVVYFAKNTEGISTLRQIETTVSQDDSIEFSDVSGDKNLLIAIPFYDSFIHKNAMYSGREVPSLPDSTIYMLENNYLPFDSLLRTCVQDFANKDKLVEVKSIFYPSRADFIAWQQYKITCNRAEHRNPTLSNPNMDHCGSREFCWESYLENKDKPFT